MSNRPRSLSLSALDLAGDSGSHGTSSSGASSSGRRTQSGLSEMMSGSQSLFKPITTPTRARSVSVGDLSHSRAPTPSLSRAVNTQVKKAMFDVQVMSRHSLDPHALVSALGGSKVGKAFGDPKMGKKFGKPGALADEISRRMQVNQAKQDAFMNKYASKGLSGLRTGHMDLMKDVNKQLSQLQPVKKKK